MKKLFIILLFVAGTEAANCKPLIEITTDTTEIHHDSLLIDGHLIIQDTILIETIIEKTFPKATPEQKSDYGKIAAAFFSFIFVIMSVIWGKKRAKNG
jgi:hypothetical protein